ncbi:MAG TPA: S-methyl-5-thioribose-1-phosphate isomerase [Candidatus Avanaerovorax faecigallinarum]|nr:S-methyl-5-thioribose-1-phosphate isomerase [Candidatus Avanaerovorax faecigallinarum]
MGHYSDITPLKFEGDRLYILDQTRLPGAEEWLEPETADDIWDAIYKLKVRGAPAIGVAAGYGVYVAVKREAPETIEEFRAVFDKVCEYIKGARPTAVNLMWAVNRIKNKVDNTAVATVNQALDLIRDEAAAIHAEDEAACRAMGEYGLTLLKPGMGILTHCNAGALATSRYGTCLSPIYLGMENGYDFRVFADETRPLLQGARLTSWELNKAGVDVTLICDNMAATVMKQGKINAVVVGCDRMAANGDGANKIGTSAVAILAKRYNIPFYMFVPTSTIDLETATGEDIVIEERDGKEIYEMWYERPMAPAGIKTFNPAFDVTCADDITAVITEKGIAYPPYSESLRKLVTGEDN